MSFEVFLGLGSNQNQPMNQIHRAIEYLRQHEGIKVLASASRWRTLPLDFRRQPAFINTVLVARVAWADPLALLHRTQRIERKQGRVAQKAHPYDDRPIDIDILHYEGVQQQQPRLTLPHPGLFERDFFIHLFYELAPKFVFNGGAAIVDKVSACPQRHLLMQLSPKQHFE